MSCTSKECQKRCCPGLNPGSRRLLWPREAVFAPADRSSWRQRCWHGGLGQLSVPVGREGCALMVSSSSLPCSKVFYLPLHPPNPGSTLPSAGLCMSHQSPSSTFCVTPEGKQRLCCSGASPALSAPSPAGSASALWPSAQFFSLEPGTQAPVSSLQPLCPLLLLLLLLPLLLCRFWTS